eukprot:scaffold15373_cov115-Isochrysis_galbana.AAC.4
MDTIHTLFPISRATPRCYTAVGWRRWLEPIALSLCSCCLALVRGLWLCSVCSWLPSGPPVRVCGRRLRLRGRAANVLVLMLECTVLALLVQKKNNSARAWRGHDGAPQASAGAH